MENQIKDIFGKLNKATIVSLITGTIAVVPYLAIAFVYLLMNNDITETIGTILAVIMVTAIPVFLYFISGIIFGITSLIAGIVSVNQIRNNKGPETNFRLTISGIFLGTLGMIANVVFIAIFLYAMMMAD